MPSQHSTYQGRSEEQNGQSHDETQTTLDQGIPAEQFGGAPRLNSAKHQTVKARRSTASL